MGPKASVCITTHPLLIPGKKLTDAEIQKPTPP
ncbi:MAG: hypothetical protein ACI9XZ_003237, partial [Alphaproteobacteria bacterium]